MKTPRTGSELVDMIEAPATLPWLRAIAIASLLIAAAGLVALSAGDAWAAPGDGLAPKGGVGGVNPFADTLLPEDDFFLDDEELEEDEPAEPVRPAGRADSALGGRPGAGPGVAVSPGGPPHGGGAQGGGEKRISVNPGGAARDANDVPDPRHTGRGYEVGGEPTGGVVSTEKRLDPLQIDTDTGEGSKAVITDFNFPNADILDIAKTLGKLTGKNFILDKDVKGPVTIISNSPITIGDAWRAFLTALDMNAYGIIPSGNYIRIARARDAKDKQLKTFTGDYSPNTDALITRVFSIKHINADDVSRVFRNFSSTNSRIIPHDQTNTVIVTDTGANIQKLAQMLEFLDTEIYDAGIEVLPVKYASAQELAKLLDTLIPGATTGRAAGRPAGGSSFASRRTKEGGVINAVIADERSNTLIIHANGKGVDQVRELIAKLDKKVPAPTGGGKIQVVYLQFAEAKAIAQTLNNLSSGSSGGPQVPGQRGGLGQNPTATALFEGSIKISADESTNSLVITASPNDFVIMQRVIHKLDIPRDEVFVEAVIMEVGVGKNFNFSSNVILPSENISLQPNGDLLGFLQNPIGTTGFILGLGLGKEKTYKVGDKEFKLKSLTGLLKAIQSNTKSNILATPQILTLDNTEATFETSENIPLPQVTQTATGSVAGVQKEKVALTLKIKPQINKISNFVRLDIKANLADVVNNRPLPAEVKDKALATVERRAETIVVVGDADTVVLGGLIRETETETISKIPLLGDIPVLGWLFSTREQSATRSNLLIFITPHIIRQYEKVRAVLDRKLKERDDFIEQRAGGEDSMRAYRDDMIKRLPDEKQFSSFGSRSAGATAPPTDLPTIDPADVVNGEASGVTPGAPANLPPPPLTDGPAPEPANHAEPFIAPEPTPEPPPPPTDLPNG